MLFRNLIVIFVLALPSFAFGAEHGGGHGAHPHVPSFWDLKFYIINFFIYLALVVYLVRKTAPKGWAMRRNRIQETLQASREKISAAERVYQDARIKIQSLDDDARSLGDVMKVEAQQEADEIVKSAKAQAVRIVKQARDNAEAERKISEAAVRREYALQALKLAEERLRREVTPERDKAIRTAFQDSVKVLLH